MAIKAPTQSATPAALRARIVRGVALATLFVAAGWATAADESKPDHPVLTNDDTAGVGATTLFLNGFSGGGSFTELADLTAGESLRFWTFYDPDAIHKIPPWNLAGITDETPIPTDPGDRELEPYYEMLIYAHRTSPAALDRAALRQDDLWAQLYRSPAKYRGELVHLEGKLKKLRKFEAQAMAVQGGVKDYYEGYMDVGATQEDPLFIQVTELPEGIKPGDNLNLTVGISGYFYKIFRYRQVETNKTHKDGLAPLVIGRTLTLLAPAPAEPEDGNGEWPMWLGPLFFGVVGLTVAALFALGYWFRHGDRRVHGRLSAARYGEFVPPPVEAGEPRQQDKEDPESPSEPRP